MAALVLSEAVGSLGALLKYAATHALTDGGVPGLAAMQPDGKFITKLNQTQPGQPTIQQSYYLAVTSQFKAKLTGDHQPSELPKRLLQMIETGLVGRLMGEANDLVVNTAAMSAIDPGAGKFIKDSLDFAANPQIYHTNYFAQPKVADALTRWLGLIEPTAIVATAAAKPAKRRGATRGVGASRRAINLTEAASSTSPANAPGALASAAAGRRITLAGASAAPMIPAMADTDILVIDADASAADLRRQLSEHPVSFIVVRRAHAGRALSYAFKYEEVFPQLKPNDRRAVLDALNLHESDQSTTRDASDEMTPPAISGTSPTSRRSVVLANGQPVGVLPESIEPLSTEQIAALARQVTSAKKVEERGQAQRAMPTFAPPPAPSIVALSTRRGARGKFNRYIIAPDTGDEGSFGFSAVELASEPAAPSPPSARRGGAGGTRAGKAPPQPKPTRSKPKSAAAPSTPPETCYFHAEMDEEVVVKRATTVEVLISREVIERATGAAAQGGEGKIDAARKIIVQAIPKQNFDLIDEGRAELDPPAPGAPQTLYFDLKPTNAGEGEIWIVARQGQVPLVTLMLKPQIVKTKTSTASKKTSLAQAVAPAPPLEAPLHQLRIIEKKNGNQSSFFYDLQAPELGLFESFESKPFVGERSQYVTGLYEKIEKRWLSSKQDFDDFTEELRAFGAELFDELIPEGLQKRLWENRDKIRSIQVISTEPFIPWELMHLKEPGQPLPTETKFLGQMGLVRWLHEAGFWPPDHLLIRKGRARTVVPNYPDKRLALAATQKEAKFLKAKFGATPVEPKSGEVRKLIAQPGAFDLLHFACHGAAEADNITEAQLLMEGRIEDNQYISDPLTATVTEQFANLKGPDNRPMIVLNACQAGRAGYKLTGMGGFAQAFLKRGAGVFIGALWSVGDEPASSFTEEFYTQLISGAMIAEATIKAREKARTARDATWLAYVVYGHPHLRLG